MTIFLKRTKNLWRDSPHLVAADEKSGNLLKHLAGTNPNHGVSVWITENKELPIYQELAAAHGWKIEIHENG